VLVELAGPVLVAVMEPVAGRLRSLLTQHEDVRAMQRDHAAIAAALRARDLEGARGHCRDHLAASRQAVAERVGL